MKRSANSQPPAILVVDHDPVVRNSIVTFLTRQQYLVVEANSSSEAIPLANSLDHELDLLIFDDAGETESDLSLANELLRSETRLKILQLSAVSREALAAQGRLIQNSGFLQKPFLLQHLVSAVKQILALSGTIIPIRASNAGSDPK